MKGFVEEILGHSRGTNFRLDPSWVNEGFLDQIIKDFTEDYSKYFEGDLDPSRIKYYPGLLCTLYYRIARKYYLIGEELIALEFSTLSRYLTSIELYYSAEIGAGLKINHGAGLVVGARSTLGKNCLLHQNITIGDRRGGRPVIGDNVVIYPGSSVLGSVKIGDYVVIGAHTLVLQDISSHKIVYGNPNQIRDGN